MAPIRMLNHREAKKLHCKFLKKIMTASYHLFYNGEPTTVDDPLRAIWYSTWQDGCDYWTDDFSKLVTSRFGHPACPNCGGLGWRMTAREWLEHAEKYQLENPHYVNFLEGRKETCSKDRLKLMDHYHAFRRLCES